MHNKSFLGVGWKFPPTFNRKSGSVMLVSEEEDIRESLWILLSTRKGERNMLPEFGCNLHHMAFENINGNTLAQLKEMIGTAIRQFEPRVTVNNIEVNTSGTIEGFLRIDIQYTINKSNQASNMVYPYYILEGADARFRSITQ